MRDNSMPSESRLKTGVMLLLPTSQSGLLELERPLLQKLLKIPMLRSENGSERTCQRRHKTQSEFFTEDPSLMLTPEILSRRRISMDSLLEELPSSLLSTKLSKLAKTSETRISFFI